MSMKQRTVFACLSICMLTLPGSWGCGSKEPAEAEKKKELAGQPGKSFDPSTVPPQYKEGFEKWQKGNGSKVSGPVTVTGDPTK
jgi:hypothetical protein